jgi:SAM-dependent methyltransferase
MPMQATYNSGIFEVANLDDARRIILTPEGGLTTDERWESETPYLVGLVAENLQLTADSVIVDYGCGIGRLARELIARYGCRVVGVDISAQMRSLAERFDLRAGRPGCLRRSVCRCGARGVGAAALSARRSGS